MKTIFINQSPENTLVKFNKKNLQNKFCLSPFVSVRVNINGDVYICGCYSWMPTAVGNILRNSIHEILNNFTSQTIRSSIIDGTYEYCNESTCGIIRHNQLNDYNSLPEYVKPLVSDPSKYIIPREIYFSGDRICNLSCPSCRTGVLKDTESVIEEKNKLAELMYKNLFSVPSNEHIRLHTSTTGEIFASTLLMTFLQNINKNDFPNLKLCIQTNGLLAEKRWNDLGSIKDNVEKITVTTDAATPGTYEKLRRGGKWQDIQRALKWLAMKKQENGMKLHTRMVVQLDNYKEINEFYEQSKILGADCIEFSRIGDWGTYSKSEFKEIDVLDPSHAEYRFAQDELDKICRHTDVFTNG